MMVEMGSDRIHHGFWLTWTRGTGSSSRAIHCGMRSTIIHMLLDREIASLLELVDPAGPTCSSSPTMARSGSMVASASMTGSGARLTWFSNPSRLLARRRPNATSTWSRNPRMGRGGLLRPHFPQRPRPRAGGNRRACRLRQPMRRTREPLEGNPDDCGQPLSTDAMDPARALPQVKACLRTSSSSSAN